MNETLLSSNGNVQELDFFIINFFYGDWWRAQRKTSCCCNFLFISFDAFRLWLWVLQEWLQLTVSSICSTFVSLSLINFQWRWITSETCCKRMLQETPPKGAVFFWVVKSIFKIALLLLLPPLPPGRLSWGHGRCTYRISLLSPSQRKTLLFRQPVLVCFAASLSNLSKISVRTDGI